MRLFDFIREMSVPTRHREGERKLAAWEKSARVAATIVNPGPDVSRLKAEEVVSVLRAKAQVAETIIREVTELEPHPEHVAAFGDSLAQVLVVDRASWAKLGSKSMAQLLGVDTAEPIDGVPDPTDLDSVVEVTAVLTFLAQKTLGQFIPNLGDDEASSVRPESKTPLPDESASGMHMVTSDDARFGTPQPKVAGSESPTEGIDATGWQSDRSPGVLALVAPNVLATQRAMAVDLGEFALWVSIHEFTHAMQFAAAPWMKRYLQDRVDALIRNFDSEGSLLEWARAATDSLRGTRSVMDSLLNDAQHAQVDRITALMSVLEGHADVVMDAVPLKYLPSKRAMRRKFTARKRDQSKLSTTVGRMSGLDAKTDQYKVGASFVRSAQSLVGTRGFNRVFTGPQYLPTLAELSDASMWVRRTNQLMAQGITDELGEGVA